MWHGVTQLNMHERTHSETEISWIANVFEAEMQYGKSS